MRDRVVWTMADHEKHAERLWRGHWRGREAPRRRGGRAADRGGRLQGLLAGLHGRGDAPIVPGCGGNFLCVCAGEGGRPRARAPPILAAACRAPRRHYVAPPARRPANRQPLRRAPRAQSRVRGSAGQVPASSTRDGGLERRRAARSGGGCNGGKARPYDSVAGLFRPASDIVRAAIRGGRPRRSSRRGTPPRARRRYLPAARGRRPAGGLGHCPAIAFFALLGGRMCADPRPASVEPAAVESACEPHCPRRRAGMERDNAAAVRIVPSSCLYGGPEAPV